MYQVPGAMSGSGPVYREIARGVGIDPRELEAIKRVSMQVYQSGVSPMAKAVSEGIKQNLGGEWFAFVNPAGDETYEFSLTRVKGTDFVSFVIDNTKFQVCRIKAY
jgi:hypothetical protein